MYDDSYKSNKSSRQRFLIFLLLSLLLIHLPAGITVWRIFDEGLTTLRPDSRIQNKPVMLELKNPSPPRIADIDKPSIEQTPDNPSAVGKYNSKVKEETVAAHSKPTQKTVPAKKSSQPTKPQSKKTEKPETKNPIKTEVETPSLSSDINRLKMLRESEQKKKDEKLFGQNKSDPFTGSLPTRNSVQGGDYFPDYKVGGRTYLNVLARPNVFYFVELKRKFRAAFNPAPVLRPLIGKLPKGGVSVVWGFSISKNGKLSQPFILKSSGLPAYDNEAKRTIMVSQPFTNPPQEFLDAEGVLNLAWTFIVSY